MKCLMLKQPWAWLVATGRKTIETRTWQTKYRGPLAIGASQLCDVVGGSDLLSRSIHFPPGSQLVRGAVIATAHLSLIEPYRKDHEAFGLLPFQEGEKRFAWFLDDVKMLETPVPVKGRLGLFDIDLDACGFCKEPVEDHKRPCGNCGDPGHAKWECVLPPDADKKGEGV